MLTRSPPSRDLLLEPESKQQEQVFRQDLAVGASAKEILKSLLESSGYTVYPFGYEGSMSALKREMAEKGFAYMELSDSPKWSLFRTRNT